MNSVRFQAIGGREVTGGKGVCQLISANFSSILKIVFCNFVANALTVVLLHFLPGSLAIR